ncbi:MAG: hypothetical protein WCX95_05125 [Candidatus Gracilibacteria bacterium]
MEKFTYKVAFFTHEIDVSKELITYRGKNIPGNSITGIGFAFVKAGQAIAGGLLGGIIGTTIANKAFEMGGNLDKNLANLPNTFGQMIITYCEDGSSQKVLRVPISAGDENCKKMMEAVVKIFSEKFVGFGGQPIVEKELKISHKVTYIVVGIIIAIVVGILLYGAFMEPSGF